MRVSCGVCGEDLKLGAVYAWLNKDDEPADLCGRCVRSLCEWARSEGLDVPWKGAHAV